MINFETGEGESNLRYKARLERHQRTVERAVCEVSKIFMLFNAIGQFFVLVLIAYAFP